MNAFVQFSGPDRFFKPTKVGDLPQTFSFSDTDLLSNSCRLSDWSSLCGPPLFEFTDIESNLKITNFPHKGLTWLALTYQLTIHPNRDDTAGQHKVHLTVYHPSLKNVR